MLAAGEGHVGVCVKLAEVGADVNLKSEVTILLVFLFAWSLESDPVPLFRFVFF